MHLRIAVLLTVVLLLGGCNANSDDAPPAPPVAPPSASPAPPPAPTSGPIVGAANATVKSVLVDIDTGDTYVSGEVSVDALGQEIVRTKLEIVFRPTATVAQANGLLTRINASITSALLGLEGVVVRIPDPGTLAALDGIVASIEAEPFVWFVSRAVLPATSAVPNNMPDVETLHSVIGTHTAVRAPAAWNVRAAAGDVPTVIIMDYFGDGAPDGNLDYEYLGNAVDDFGVGNLDAHGYHVAGILAGRFGGDDSWPGRVTGMLAGPLLLSVVDLTKVDPLDARNAAINRLRNIASADPTTVIFSESLGYGCTVDSTCVPLAVVRSRGAWWALKVREFELENSFVHFVAANNIEAPYAAADAAVGSVAGAAALRTDLVDGIGTPVPALTNTVVVENVWAAPEPFGTTCLHGSSFHGGHLAGSGVDAYSFTAASGAAGLESGTSMATPQAAGLAAMLLSIDPTLSPQQLKSILISSARPVSVVVNDDCSTWPTPAPLIDAYAAVLALDDAAALVSGNLPNVSVRGTLLDVDSSGQYREDDLDDVLSQLDTAAGAFNYGRFDFNGDGFTGGMTRAPFDLDANGVIDAAVTLDMDGATITFNESNASDYDVACYYAYTPLYTGATGGLAEMLAPYRQLGLCPATLSASVRLLSRNGYISAQCRASLFHEPDTSTEDQDFQTISQAPLPDPAQSANVSSVCNQSLAGASVTANSVTSVTVSESLSAGDQLAALSANVSVSSGAGINLSDPPDVLQRYAHIETAAGAVQRWELLVPEGVQVSVMASLNAAIGTSVHVATNGDRVELCPALTVVDEDEYQIYGWNEGTPRCTGAADVTTAQHFLGPFVGPTSVDLAMYAQSQWYGTAVTENGATLGVSGARASNGSVSISVTIQDSP